MAHGCGTLVSYLVLAVRLLSPPAPLSGLASRAWATPWIVDTAKFGQVRHPAEV